MKPSNASILLHPFFLTNLILLLLNDCYWKYAYPNWFTGKLSDFAGLITLSFFLCAFFRNKKMILIFCGLFFIWWKSAFSQPAIEFFNDFFSIKLHRTIDYSDLIALLVLPLVFIIHPLPVHIPFKKFAVYSIAFASLFAFCNTSLPPRQGFYSYIRENEVSFYEEYPTSKNKEEILQKLTSLGIIYYKETQRFYPINETDVYYRIKVKDSFYYSRLNNSKDSSLFVKRVSDTFYVLPLYVINGDSLKNIEFNFYATNRKKKPFSVHVESFETTQFSAYEYYRTKREKLYKKAFEKLFE